MATTRLNSRVGLAGSTGNLLHDTAPMSPQSSTVRPPPPARGLSTFSSSQQQRTSHGPDTQSGKAAVYYNPNGVSGNAVGSSAVSRLSKRFASTDNLTDSGSDRVPTVGLTPSRTIQTENKRTSMKRFGSEDNLLSPRLVGHQQRLLSDDLPPPPSPSSIANVEAVASNYARLQVHCATCLTKTLPLQHCC